MFIYLFNFCLRTSPSYNMLLYDLWILICRRNGRERVAYFSTATFLHILARKNLDEQRDISIRKVGMQAKIGTETLQTTRQRLYRLRGNLLGIKPYRLASSLSNKVAKFVYQIQVTWAHNYYVMARPQDTYRRNVLQKCRTAANVLQRHSRRAYN
jgi:hypothetical protein